MSRFDRFGFTMAITIVFLLALASPASGQALDGAVVLTYDAGTATIEVFAYTNLDIASIGDYTVGVEVSVFRNGQFDSYDFQGSSIRAVLGQDIVAYPGATYTATAVHSFYLMSPGAEGYNDPYMLTTLGFQNTGASFFSADAAGYQEGYETSIADMDIAETTAEPVQTPGAQLNVTAEGGYIIQNNVSVSNTLCPTDNTAAGEWPEPACAFFKYASGDTIQTPQMPALEAWLTGINTSLPLTWRAGIQFYRACTNENNYTGFYGGSEVSLPASQHFNITSNLGLPSAQWVQGGGGDITYHIGDQEFGVALFAVWGNSSSPSANAVQRYVNQNPNSPWYALYILKGETAGYHQFNSGSTINGTPNFGPPCGWGLSQQDPPGQFQHTPSEVVWNWQANVDDGITEMNNKHQIGTNQWNGTKGRYLKDSNRPAAPCAEQVGAFTFCYDTSQGAKPFAEANAIKCYNGCRSPTSTT